MHQKPPALRLIPLIDAEPIWNQSERTENLPLTVFLPLKAVPFIKFDNILLQVEWHANEILIPPYIYELSTIVFKGKRASSHREAYQFSIFAICHHGVKQPTQVLEYCTGELR
jgi:hypothetical protein